MFPISDTKNSNKFPFINLLIIAANIYVFYLELTAPNIELILNKYALIPANVNVADLNTFAPFVTSMFLHAGFLHILSNMWFLWIFGDNVEAKIGHLKYLIFYLFCGIIASVVQYFFIHTSSLPMLGASGAIAGILGAYLRFFPKNKVDTLIPIFILPLIVPIPAAFMLFYWFAIQAFASFSSITTTTMAFDGIAYTAHASGFLVGFLFAKSFVWQRR